MKKGLFINNPKSKDSIHESGFMAYQCLKLSKLYSLDYLEVDKNSRKINTGYDFYFFNYHDVTMSWLDTSLLKKKLGCVITMILEVLPGDPFVRCPENDFSYYCALDPTLVSRGNMFAFPRPLEKINFALPEIKNDIPIIGSFGFATKGKGFEHVVEAVNKEFDKAVVKINIPYGDFVPDSDNYSQYLKQLCISTAKPGIEVQVTHEFFTKYELIKWCSLNDLNCFLYDRDFPGLAATTDQAIITGKPLSVSLNNTFRHITAFLPSYPEFSLRDSIAKSPEILKRINIEWSQETFCQKFEEVFSKIKWLEKSRNGTEEIDLPLFKKSISHKIKSRVKKYKRLIKKAFKNS